MQIYARMIKWRVVPDPSCALIAMEEFYRIGHRGGQTETPASGGLREAPREPMADGGSSSFPGSRVS